MLYVDTSVLVASIVEEPKSTDVRKWLGHADPEELVISDWVVSEFSSALSVKVRTGQIDIEQRKLALTAFSTLVNDSANVLPIISGHFRMAARYADNHRSGLRAGDALHLAIAEYYGASVHTLDVTLASAGSMFGVETNLL
jgi:uncharacterized protein